MSYSFLDKKTPLFRDPLSSRVGTRKFSGVTQTGHGTGVLERSYWIVRAPGTSRRTYKMILQNVHRCQPSGGKLRSNSRCSSNRLIRPEITQADQMTAIKNRIKRKPIVAQMFIMSLLLWPAVLPSRR